MKKLPNKETKIRFSTPDPITNIVRVSRFLPNKKEESIGMIYPVFNEEQELVAYHSIKESGEPIAPPTIDFGDIEMRFEKSILENHESPFQEEIDSQIEEYERREKKMSDLRVIKKSNTNRVINR